MSVHIKPLKGFKNYMNGENNTLSLLVKSNCKLREHLSKAKEKLIASLTCIINNNDSNHDIYFYHKLQILNGRRRADYPKTKAYEMKLDNIKAHLNNSMKDILRLSYGEYDSHFVNIVILLDDKEIELSKDEFNDLNWKIRSALSKINNEECVFVDDDEVEPIEKKENKCLSQDSDDEDNKVEPIKKKLKKDVVVKPSKRKKTSVFSKIRTTKSSK